MPDDLRHRVASDSRVDAAEWQRIVEAQQREIESLRSQAQADAASGDDDSHRPPSALSSLGSALSTPRSSCGRLSGDAERVDIDRERFEALCCKLQRARSKLVKRDVQTRDARAQVAALQQQLRRACETHAQLKARANALDLELQREAAAKAQAVERAAEALVQCDTLKALAERSEARARSEALVHQTKARDLEDAIRTLKQENARQQAEVTALAGDREELARQLRSAAATERACGGQCDTIRQQLLVLQEEAPRLSHALELQTRRAATQQQAVQALASENARLALDLQRTRDEHELHAAHLLQATLALDQQLTSAQQRARELGEQRAMAAEELELLRLKDALRAQQLRTYSDDYALLLGSYRELVRASSGMELSRRDLRAELTGSRKQVAALRRSLETLDAEIQKLSRAVAATRSREQSVGRALREYARRNHVLESAVGATKSQLRAVADSLRASERRKAQAVTQASELKRGLVVEKCQRSDLLRQCGELERCLASCHASAAATQQRARLLQSENGVLLDAVRQLCAYSHELVASEQLLRRELKHLEVTGKAEPAVFG